MEFSFKTKSTMYRHGIQFDRFSQRTAGDPTCEQRKGGGFRCWALAWDVQTTCADAAMKFPAGKRCTAHIYTFHTDRSPRHGHGEQNVFWQKKKCSFRHNFYRKERSIFLLDKSSSKPHHHELGGPTCHSHGEQLKHLWFCRHRRRWLGRRRRRPPAYTRTPPRMRSPPAPRSGAMEFSVKILAPRLPGLAVLTHQIYK